jgi:hypothetical protein
MRLMLDAPIRRKGGAVGFFCAMRSAWRAIMRKYKAYFIAHYGAILHNPYLKRG